MTNKKPRNLKEYTEQLSTSKIAFYRIIRKKTKVSITMVEKWAKMDSGTKNPLYLKVLSKETGITIENLFKEFD